MAHAGESRKGLGSVILKINTQHTLTVIGCAQHVVRGGRYRRTGTQQIPYGRVCGTRGQDPTPLLPGPIGAESVHAAQGPRTGDVIRQGGRREAGRREEGGHASAQSRLAFFSADCTHNEALCAWLTIGVGVAWQDANADQGIDFTTWTFPAY